MRRPKITVSADGKGLVSQAGTLLLAEAARATGLDQGLAGALAQWRAPRAVHDPGKILTACSVAMIARDPRLLTTSRPPVCLR